MNGKNTAPVYKFLKSEKGGYFGDAIKWNFTKFLVNKEGKVVERYAPTTSPLKIEVRSLFSPYYNIRVQGLLRTSSDISLFHFAERHSESAGIFLRTKVLWLNLRVNLCSSCPQTWIFSFLISIHDKFAPYML